MNARIALGLGLGLLAAAANAAPDVGDVERGKRIYLGEETIEGVAACHTCHGKDGNETQAASFPRLAGQYADYMVHALTDYKTGARVNAVMNPMAAKLTRKDMQDVSAYLAGLPGDLKDLSEVE